jgi:hypothetical protein
MSAAEAFYREMVSFGLSVEARDGTIYVSPAEQITDALRAKIRTHKPELLALLSGAEPPPLSPADHEAIREAIEERAAIREFDGGESRQVAEREARSAMRVYQYRLTDRPDTWLTMLAPECDLDEARHDLELRFGPERLIEVRERTS